MRYSDSFRRAFTSAYHECHSRFADEARKRNYQIDWNRFMLWRPEPPLQQSVLTLTAENMGLAHWEPEPFRFDGAFVPPDFRIVEHYPVPIIAVFEHEDKIEGFEEEVLKLAHVRCPLKIGITYSNRQLEAEHKGRILKWVSDIFHQVNKHAKEDPESEYVYLLGVEEHPYEVAWHHLSFDAASGPGTFKALGFK